VAALYNILVSLILIRLRLYPECDIDSVSVCDLSVGLSITL